MTLGGLKLDTVCSGQCNQVPFLYFTENGVREEDTGQNKDRSVSA